MKHSISLNELNKGQRPILRRYAHAAFETDATKVQTPAPFFHSLQPVLISNQTALLPRRSRVSKWHLRYSRASSAPQRDPTPDMQRDSRTNHDTGYDIKPGFP